MDMQEVCVRNARGLMRRTDFCIGFASWRSLLISEAARYSKLGNSCHRLHKFAQKHVSGIVLRLNPVELPRSRLYPRLGGLGQYVIYFAPRYLRKSILHAKRGKLCHKITAYLVQTSTSPRGNCLEARHC